MSALDDLGNAVHAALKEETVDDVLALLTGCFVGLTLEVLRRNGHDDESKDIHIDGGSERDITIHAKKEPHRD